MANKEYIERENYCKNICLCSEDKCEKDKCPIWCASTADVVEVVRCKDCQYAHYWYGNDILGNTTYLCHFFHDRFYPKVHGDDYCSFGKSKRRTNNA